MYYSKGKYCKLDSEFFKEEIGSMEMDFELRIVFLKNLL